MTVRERILARRPAAVAAAFGHHFGLGVYHAVHADHGPEGDRDGHRAERDRHLAGLRGAVNAALKALGAES